MAFGNSEIENAWEVIFTLDIRWILAALGGWFAYLFFDSLTYYYCLKNQGHKIKLGTALYIGIVGFYFSDITPGASGGQPMQVYEMSKRNIPVGIGTGAVTVRFIMNQFVTIVIAVVLWATNLGFVSEQIGSLQGFYIAGFFINAGVIPVVFLAAFFPGFIYKIGCWFISLGAKLHFVKKPEEAKEKYSGVLDTYKTSFRSLIKQPLQLLVQFIISALCMLGLFFVTYFVYRAFGLNEFSWVEVLTITVLLFISASYTPLPGASGAQEGGFLLYFAGIFPETAIGLALLVWRFITFYLFLIVGAFTTIVGQIKNNRSAGKKDRLVKGFTGDSDVANEEMKSYYINNSNTQAVKKENKD